jgi:CubicO group peptidase (beta-lactamase class C family)/lysophospholipase L1-like esterase
MKKLAVFAILTFTAAVCVAGEPSSLPRTSPEAQGISSGAVLAFVDAAEREIDALHSFMLLRHGHVVAEGWWSPYDARTPHALYSLSKSFTSTAVGLAVTEGKLTIDDEVLKFFPGDAPNEPGNNLSAMRVHDLLRMSTGHQAEPAVQKAEIWTRAFLAQPVPHKPGTHFLYNTPATYMLSAIVQKATGKTVLDYLGPRLFEPMGIEHPTWGTSPQGITLGGYGLSVRTEDIAKFGQLYLQKGRWGDRQLLPESWVEAATARQTSNGSNPNSDWDRGYGYQFWRCRHGAYRGDGAFGQFCVVLPDHDAVIAITSGVKNMQAVLDLVWDRLLPAMETAPLASDEMTQEKLRRRLSELSLRPQAGAASSGIAERVAGKTYLFPDNERKLESLTLEPNGEREGAVLVARIDGIDRRVRCGQGNWHKQRFAYGPLQEQAAAVSGAWTADDTYTAKVCFVETPFVVTLTLKFTGEELRLDSESNVAFGPTRLPAVIGSSKARPQRPEAFAPPTAEHDFSRWEEEIAAYETADRANPPPRGGVLFIGSSTIRLWKSLADDYPGHKVINRGFGGSEIVDATHFAERLIFPHEPRQVFLRAGGNDIHGGRLPDEVGVDFVNFVRKVRERLPQTEILYIAVSPAPARWGESDKYRALNQKIRELAVKLPRVGYVDAYDLSLHRDGRARVELFLPDQLHFNAEGYKLLADCVRPYLVPIK